MNILSPSCSTYISTSASCCSWTSFNCATTWKRIVQGNNFPTDTFWINRPHYGGTDLVKNFKIIFSVTLSGHFHFSFPQLNLQRCMLNILVFFLIPSCCCTQMQHTWKHRDRENMPKMWKMKIFYSYSRLNWIFETESLKIKKLNWKINIGS